MIVIMQIQSQVEGISKEVRNSKENILKLCKNEELANRPCLKYSGQLSINYGKGINCNCGL